MKTKLMYAAVCLIFASVLFAGEGMGEKKGYKGNRKGRKHLDSSKDMTRNLELTADQKVKTDKFSKEFHSKAKEIRNSDLEGPKKREAFMVLRKNHNKNIDSVLTPKQRRKAQQNRKERNCERKQNRAKRQNRNRKRNQNKRSGNRSN